MLLSGSSSLAWGAAKDNKLFEAMITLPFATCHHSLLCQWFKLMLWSG